VGGISQAATVGWNLLRHPGDTLRTAGRLGAFDPLLGVARAAALRRWGPGLGALVAAAARRCPDRVAVIDETGALTYRELDGRTASIAAGFVDRLGASARGGEPAAVGILARNHRGFLEAQIGIERAGLDLVLLSTALPAAGLAVVAERERLALIVADEELLGLVSQAGYGDRALTADGRGPGTVDELARSDRTVPGPRHRSGLVILTSGTTGPPRGARRTGGTAGADAMSIFDAIPYRVGDVHHPAAPLFHAWGLSQAAIALGTASTVVLRRRFDAAAVWDLVDIHRVSVLSVVPTMLGRLLGAAGDRPAPASLRVVASSGNVLPAGMAAAFMDRFGDTLYNLYGSTEASIATIAGPEDLRAAPGTVGRPPAGVTVAILDAEGRPVPVGGRGRVFVGNSMQFDGYSDGGDRERAGALMATADLGWFDGEGRLFVDGREDDLIVTGGENVFPSEVEEVLEGLPGVDEAAVVGPPDDEYGQVVVAYVVPTEGTELDPAELRAAAALTLARFKVPRRITVIDALPRTATDKLIRHMLPALRPSGPARQYTEPSE